MSETSPRPRSFWAGWIAAGVLLLAAAAAGVYAANLRNQYQDVELRLIDAVTKLQLSEQQRADVTSALGGYRTNLALLGASDVRIVPLSGNGVAAETTGRIFVSPSKGILFAAAKLPPLAEGSVYQLWMLTRNGPASIGLARPMDDGNLTAAYDPPTGSDAATGFAMSVEPESGSTKPTSPFLLASK